MSINTKMYKSCRRGNIDTIRQILNDDQDDFDIMWNYGSYFELAVINNRQDILLELLNYCDKIIKQGDLLHRYQLTNKLRDVLASARDSYY